MTQEHPLRSVHTSNLPEILKQLNCSLVVSTYQAGRVILVRYEETAGEGAPKGAINTHFRQFDKPMGICVKDNRLSIGGTNTVWEYRNVPGAAQKLEPPDKHDACYVPSSIHFTGNIDIHEMSWADDDQLWLVNTRFSCLCTLDDKHNFYPRWRPGFVSALSPEDRCHLNGLAMRDGKPRYVTALGETDSRGEWRANKASGGILMDIDSGAIILRGLSMPHSPRWYRNKLWVLESGKGSLSVVDPLSGVIKTVASMPGFTRGIDFIGPLAFIGLSKVRESAVFSGIPIVKDLTERVCGVWVVNIETGEILAFLRFEAGVEEIFAVQILHGTRCPEMLLADDPLINITYVLPDEALADVALPTPQQFEASPHGVMARGLEHFGKQEFAQAVLAFRECLKQQADFPEARYSLAIALAETGELTEALEHLEAAREKEPDRSEIHLSIGSLYQRLGDYDKARAAFEMAITRQPENALAHLSLGVLLLQLGEYSRGLEEYQWRLKTGQVPVLRSPHPGWDGKPAPDKTLLLYIEHDDPRHVILLARYIPQLAAQFRKLIVMCPDSYAPLLAALQGVGEIRKPGDVNVSEFDTQISFDSLPYLLGAAFETIPGNIPYIDAALLGKRKGESVMIDATGALKVGVVLNNGALSADELKPNRYGSVVAEAVTSLVTVPGVEFYSLTYPARDAASTQTLDGLIPQERLTETSDLSDLALLIDQMDLVIGIESPAIHLAGALGKPTWLVLGTVFDWCWPALSETTPWYPDTRIFRKGKNGDWSALVMDIRAALEAWVVSSKAKGIESS